jgi:hypothetical protein
LDLAERLFDTALIRLEVKKFVWYLNVHHIIIDGMSRAILFQRVAELYGQSLAGSLPEKISLPAFADFLTYEREYRQSQRYRVTASYWKQRLAEKTEALCFYGRRGAVRTRPLVRMSTQLGVARTGRIKRLAARPDIGGRSENAGLFNLMAAAVLAYVHRITGSRRPFLGTAIHNRPSNAFRDTIGFFMEVLPLRLDVDERDTFLSLVKKVRAEALETFPHSYAIANAPQNKANDVLLNFQTISYGSFNDMPVFTPTCLIASNASAPSAISCNCSTLF